VVFCDSAAFDRLHRFIPFPKSKRNLDQCERWILHMYVHCNREHHQLNVDKFDGNYNMYVCSKVNDNRSTFLF